MKKNKCKVLSFGINHDPTFDIEIQKLYGCQIDSFDPFIEAKVFKDFRQKNPQIENSVSLQISPKWRFHRIGIIGNSADIKNVNKIGWMTTLDKILEHSNLKDKVKKFLN